MATGRNANGAGEASVPPAPSASARETRDASVARLSGLNTVAAGASLSNCDLSSGPAMALGFLAAGADSAD